MRTKIWVVGLGTVLLVAAGLWWQTMNHATVSPSEPGKQSKPNAAANEAEIQKAAPETPPVTDEQIQRARDIGLAQLGEAAKAVPAARQVEGVVSQRPSFVAAFEWEMLQEAAAKSPDKEKALTHLVNKLLFFKKYEMWESLLAAGGDATARHALANEILAMIPAMMPVLGPEQSAEMERALSADLNRK